MIRLFVALDLPDNIRREVEGMGRSIQNARPVPEDQLHLTLKFIGEVESSRFLDIDEALEEIISAPFSFRLKGVGTFPPRGMPNTLWAGVEPANQLTSLRNSIEKKLESIRIPREKRKYTPHLTLARMKNCPIDQLQQFLAGNAFLQTSDFTVECFHLYSSKLTPKGAQHTLERSYQLRG